MRYSSPHRAKRGYLCVAAFGLAAALLFASCAQEEAVTVGSEYAIDEQYERGPMTLTLRIDRKELSIAERLHLSLNVLVDEGYEVDMPGFGEKLEQFAIVDFSDTPPKLAEEGRVALSRTYTLEPFLSGDYTIPPMTLHFWERDGDVPEEERHEIETEEVTVKVTSLLPEDLAELAIKDIAGPVEIPVTSRWRTVALVLMVVLAVACGAGYFLWRRLTRQREEKLVRIPPHDQAFQALEALLARQLIEKGEFKEFYIGVSDVLRRFIENRFGLHAPERTTEEFLYELQDSPALDAAQKAVLRSFLTHCDLVKFAEHRPANEEIQQTFDTCKQFIMDTPKTDAAAADAEAA